MREAFELWYTANYWDFNYNHNVKYSEDSEAYDHMDVNLAYQAFKAGFQYAKDIGA